MFFRLTAPIDCPGCSGVAFCSTACRDEALVYHKWECQFGDLLYASGMSLNCYLALRIITKCTAAQLKEVSFVFLDWWQSDESFSLNKIFEYLNLWKLYTFYYFDRYQIIDKKDIFWKYILLKR